MNFTTATLDEILEAGKQRGYRMGEYQTRPEVGSTQPGVDGVGEVVIDDDTIADDYMTQCAYASEENDRSFTPFEFTASEINKRDDSEDAWEMFSDGIDIGIAEAIAANRAAHDAKKGGAQ